MIRRTGSIDLSKPTGRSRFVRTKATIQKITKHNDGNKRVSARRIARELGISATSVRRILKEDLGLTAYRRVVEPLLSGTHLLQRKKFAN